MDLLLLDVTDFVPSINAVGMVDEFYLASNLMIESANEGVLEKIALVIECDFRSILGEHNCFLTGDFKLD